MISFKLFECVFEKIKIVQSLSQHSATIWSHQKLEQGLLKKYPNLEINMFHTIFSASRITLYVSVLNSLKVVSYSYAMFAHITEIKSLSPFEAYSFYFIL